MAASEEKPYRVYRGGRDRGKVPLESREREARRARRGDGGRGSGPITRKGKQRRRLWLGWTWRRWTLVTLLGLVVLFVVWGVAGYLAVSSGVSAANARVPKNVRAVLAPDSGLLYSNPTNILLIGTDHATGKGSQGRSVDQHSDSLTVLHTDPGRGRIVYLSIPRDLYVPVPGQPTEMKINAAMQIGGAPLAIRTVNKLLGNQLRINHVVFVDFNQFVKLIDAVGGITVNVPENILSNKFDCPYPAKRCATWKGWRFRKGPTHMNGHQALIFSRIRENYWGGHQQGSFTDFTRQHDQQLVEQATLSKLSSPSLFFSLPFNGGDLLRPIATDLSTWQLLQLAWVKFRSSTASTLHCRLGGTPGTSPDGQAVIQVTPDDIHVVREVLGLEPAQPPAAGNLYAPGCYVGSSGSFK